MDDGHALGLKVACNLNIDLCNKVFIDNCGLSEQGMTELMAGFSELAVLR